MSFEDELSNVMQRAGDGFRPAAGPALVEGGLARGRRKAARRRAALGGGVLALAAVGVAGSYATGLIGADGKTAAPGDERVSVAAPARPTGSGPADIGLTADEKRLLSTFKALLPEGETSQEYSKDGTASVVFDDGKGAAAISVGLSMLNPNDALATDSVTCPSQALVRHDACTAERLADGSRYMLLQKYEYPDRREPTKVWRATLLTPKGELIDASEYNAPAEKGEKTTRPTPPLTASQMKRLVTDPSWQPALRDLREATHARKNPTHPARPGASDRDTVSNTLAALLPAGLKVSDKGGQEEYGFVVADDGKGKSFVQINVQSGMGDVTKHFDPAKTRKLPDGTTVMRDRQANPDGKGGARAVGWTVDTVRPDGFRVVLMAFNAPGQGQNASRAEPVLTMDQMQAIALDEKWLTLR
ncbi:hypothetical protein [Streptomyces sp. NPDC003077]|uniref:hypothetical protein n=1 Tax=Streptomyces sp. NPDC003077 TaxID=3154443 RepID=UPI0033BE263F